MAERLAPERVLRATTSKPESVRRPLARGLRWLIVGAALVLVVLALAVTLAHFLAVSTPARDTRPSSLIPAGMPARALVVLARPGQEVPMAGTLAQLKDAGVEVTVLMATRGESQRPALAASSTDIGQLRAAEAERSAQILGVHEAVVADLGDGHVMASDPEVVRTLIRDVVKRTHPAIIISAADVSGVDSDSRALATYSVDVAREASSGVGRVWALTRSARELGWLLREPLPAAPTPSAAVVVAADSGVKRQSLAAYGTLSPDLVASTYPLCDRIPPWAYFRFWDREYFALAWGEPQP